MSGSFGNADGLDPANEDIVVRCAAILFDLESPKHWMTAPGLARELGGAFTENEIRDALIAESARPDRRIRYSYYPSRRTLDLLWGHIEVVKELANLSSPHREDPSPNDPVSDYGSGSVFLSHNHRDASKVLDLADQLGQAGIACWRFQTGIKKGEIIAESVQEAVSSARVFVTFISENSIGSLWVQKELVGRQRLGNPPVIVVADGQDTKLLTLLEDLPAIDRRKAVEYSKKRAEKLKLTQHDDWIRRSADFLRELGSIVSKQGKLFRFPNPNDTELPDDLIAAIRHEIRRQ